MNLASWILVAIIGLVVVLILRKLYKDKKAGKICSGCSGSGCACGCGDCKSAKKKP